MKALYALFASESSVLSPAGCKPVQALKGLLAVALAVPCMTQAASPPPEPATMKEGVVRAWVAEGGGLGNKPEASRVRFGLGDTLVVEVKNFNGWVIGLADTLHFVDDDLSKGTTEAVRTIIRNGYLKRASDANVVIRRAALGILNESLVKEFVDQGALSSDDSKVLTRIREEDMARRKNAVAVMVERLPLASGKQELSTLQVVGEVLKLPSFASLVKLLPPDPAQQVETLVQDVPQLVKKLQFKKAEALRLRINDLEMPDIKVANPLEEPESNRPKASSYDDYFWYRFPIAETEQNSAVWHQLRKRIPLSDNIRLTLVCPFADRSFQMRTAIEYLPDDSVSKGGYHNLQLVIISNSLFWLALVIMGLCVSLFWISAQRTDLIRDTLGDLRPDGILPYSLARSQMAFWFLLVVGSFLFLYISLNKVPELNNTCLWLIGIGAGTALGAAVITQDRSQTGGGAGKWTFKRLGGEGRPAFLKRLDDEITTTEKAVLTDAAALSTEINNSKQTLDDKKAELSTAKNTTRPGVQRNILALEQEIQTKEGILAGAEEAAKEGIRTEIRGKRTELANKKSELVRLTETMAQLNADISTLQAAVWQKEKILALAQRVNTPGFHEGLSQLKAQRAECGRQGQNRVIRLLDDWMTEDGRYSFHRYQMFTWTIVLGFVFVLNVVTTRSLPVFHDTLLALLGISNGTYLGFRLPATASAKKE